MTYAAGDPRKQQASIVPAMPFESVRDYVAALERRGRLLRLPAMDQDRYEASAFAYRLIERFGIEQAPAFLIERLKIGGRWRDGPVVANAYGRWPDEALLFGVDQVTDDPQQMYRAVLAELESRLDAAGNWRRIAPVAVADPRAAPCKEVVLTGDQVDLESFAWLQNNPADGGRYVNMGSVFIQDPELGRNVGTYRCQVKGPRRMGVNPEPGQHGWRILMGMKARGDRSAKVAVAVAPDPMTFCASSTKMAGYLEDELEFAGGLRGQPLPVVKCETSDIMVPASSEFVIEGEVSLTEFEEEGPFGEMYGYLGPKKAENFVMQISAITHRRQPWVLNSFTGLTCDLPRAPQVAASFFQYRKLIPSLTGLNSPRGATGVIVISIDKKFPGEGIAAGQCLAANAALHKVVIVVDKDLDILDPSQVLHALGARWQPTASLLIPRTQMMMPDPSRPVRGLSSKIVIDATRQWPGEGGPKSWAPLNRDLLLQGAPGAFDLVDSRWAEYLQGWKP
ncbi:MAG: menaquinone biosynthesis decarboxylase [Gammaproteobacteria bacterium]|nr:MAG: menaquinone biosynthesis decarboxylase [Gammaproteobacteria bacterium]